MATVEGLDHHFRFLVLAVETQAHATRRYLLDPGRKGLAKLHAREEYIDNLKTVVDNECIGAIHGDGSLPRDRLNRLRAIQGIVMGLERIGDCFVRVLRQSEHLSCPDLQAITDVEADFSAISRGLAPIQRALLKGKVEGGLAICRVETVLNRIYAEGSHRVMGALEGGGNPRHLIPALCILQELERVGGEILTIGEAILFSILGEHIKVGQFEALQKTLSKSGVSNSVEGIDYRAIDGTRSGCRIGKVKGPGVVPEAQSRIYKEGPLEKMRRERANNSRWQACCPGLVPDVYSFHTEGEKASLLLEYLPGDTLDEVIRSAGDAEVQSAFDSLERTLLAIWDRTCVAAPGATDYIPQVQARLADVLAVHPAFFRESTSVGHATAHSMGELLSQCAAIEKGLQAPVSVFIHGDFNTSNVVYNHATDHVHFIDLHRSRDFDYVQDASVFLVSLFRLPMFNTRCRHRINRGIDRFYKVFRVFSEQHKDASFSGRLALALARSFYTSTRFELNADFARSMHNRAIFLLEKVQDFDDRDWSVFRFPEEILFY
ncbi:phosphotransferase [Desulfoluna spongiiphila]|uniref:phosphotransferase n=1 Tax=Desulfoluna spongiiphila TaxID=419481 RepID=UPI001254A7B6|nr:phosphotransferase [Desulfoluna spongiiphila]VVS91908.1 aminoglycoside phosphotransferase [Desulfoluna spongiiphila]